LFSESAHTLSIRFAMAMRGNVDAARDYLRTRSLDDDTLSYLCEALDECHDSSELQDFLEPFLAAEDVDEMLKLSSLCASAEAEAKKGAMHDEMAGALFGNDASRIEISLHTTVEKKHEEDEVQVSTEHASVSSSSQQVAHARASKREQLKSTNKEVESFDLEDGQSDSVGLNIGDTHFQDAGSVRKGDHVMIKDQPCRVMQITRSKIWKGPYRGCFQSHITARDIFTGKKQEATFPVTQKVNMPFVKRHEYIVMDVGTAGELDLLTSEGATKSNVNLPTGTDADAELAESIQACFSSGKIVVVVVLSACGYEKVVQCKAMD
jgi:translation initiation factor 5A